MNKGDHVVKHPRAVISQLIDTLERECTVQSAVNLLDFVIGSPESSTFYRSLRLSSDITGDIGPLNAFLCKHPHIALQASFMLEDIQNQANSTPPRDEPIDSPNNDQNVAASTTGQIDNDATSLTPESHENDHEPVAAPTGRQWRPETQKAFDDLASAFTQNLDAQSNKIDTLKRRYCDHPYHAFFPAYLLEPLLSELYGDDDPGKAIGEYMNCMFEKIETPVPNLFDRTPESSLCVQIVCNVYARIPRNPSSANWTLRCILGDTRSFSIGQFLSAISSLPSAPALIACNHLNLSLPDEELDASAPSRYIKNANDLLAVLYVPLIRMGYEGKYKDVVTKYLSNNKSTRNSAELTVKQANTRSPIFFKPTNHNRQEIRRNLRDEFRVLTSLMETRYQGQNADWALLCGSVKFNPYPELLKEYGIAPIKELMEYLGHLRTDLLEGRFPASPFEVAHLYDVFHVFLDVDLKLMDLPLLTVAHLGLSEADLLIPSDDGNICGDDIYAKKQFNKYWVVLIEKALEEQMPVFANAALAIYVLLIYWDRRTDFVSWKTLGKLISSCLNMPGNVYLSKAIRAIKQAGWPVGSDDNGRMYYLLICQYASDEPVSRYAVSDLIKFSNPQREIIAAELQGAIGELGWSKLGQRAQEYLIDADMKFSLMARNLGRDINEYGSLALVYFKAIEENLVRRLEPLIGQPEFVRAFMDLGINRPKGKLTAGTALHILNKYSNFPDDCKAKISASGLDVTSDPDIWRQLRALANERNQAAHDKFDETSLIKFRGQLFRKQLLQRFAASLG